MKLSQKISYYSSLYMSRYLLKNGNVKNFAKTQKFDEKKIPREVKVFFFVPNPTPGSLVIIDHILPCLNKLAKELQLNWVIQKGQNLPKSEVDLLICFKCVPNLKEIQGNPVKLLLICDQADVFWAEMDLFDEIISTSSFEFAKLIAWKKRQVLFIGESEPQIYLDRGSKNLETKSFNTSNILLWHGGKHSLSALLSKKDILKNWASGIECGRPILHVICANIKAQSTRWGALEVRYFPWSKKQLTESVEQARLAIIPALNGIRHTWLKPPSRIRCCYALGVPAIGDGRVPSVISFSKPFNGPTAIKDTDWLNQLNKLWSDFKELDRLANAGHKRVLDNHSSKHTACEWVRLISEVKLSYKS